MVISCTPCHFEILVPVLCALGKHRKVILGPCPKVHQDALRLQFEVASRSKDYGYRDAWLRELEGQIAGCDRHIERQRDRQNLHKDEKVSGVHHNQKPGQSICLPLLIVAFLTLVVAGFILPLFAFSCWSGTCDQSAWWTDDCNEKWGCKTWCVFSRSFLPFGQNDSSIHLSVCLAVGAAGKIEEAIAQLEKIDAIRQEKQKAMVSHCFTLSPSLIPWFFFDFLRLLSSSFICSARVVLLGALFSFSCLVWIACCSCSSPSLVEQGTSLILRRLWLYAISVGLIFSLTDTVVRVNDHFTGMKKAIARI